VYYTQHQTTTIQHTKGNINITINTTPRILYTTLIYTPAGILYTTPVYTTSAASVYATPRPGYYTLQEIYTPRVLYISPI
jgi:hypothetical protein